jgi:hypothetical protein
MSTEKKGWKASGNPPPAPGPARAGWRGEGRTESSAPKHEWQKQKAAPAADATLRRQWFRVKVFTVTGVALGLIGAYIWYLVHSPTLTPFVATYVTDYAFPIPPNSWAREDVEAYAVLHQKTLFVDTKPMAPAADNPWQRLIERLTARSPGGPQRNTIIVYLSAHGVLNSQGECCLLPPIDSGDDPSSFLDESRWLKLADLLQAIKKVDSLREVNKLLILDAGRLDAPWELGQLYNGFGDRLTNCVTDAGVENLTVLSACGPGQRANDAPEMGHTVFGKYVRDGLLGAADGDGTKGDSVLTLKELAAYVDKQVTEWMASHRADAQRPLMIPASPADFKLALVDPKLKEAQLASDPVAPAPSESPWKAADILWARHAELSVDSGVRSPRRLNPVSWAEFQQKLLYVERLTRAGSAYEGRAQELAAELAAMEKGQLGKDVLPAGLSAPSLALDLWLSGMSEPDRLRMGEIEKDLNKLLTSDEPPDQFSLMDYSRAAWGAFEQELNPKRAQQISAFMTRVENAKRSQSAGSVEVHFMRMLTRYLEPSIWSAADLPVGQSAALRNLAEAAATPADVRAVYFLMARQQAADELRRQAEDRLFVGQPSMAAEAARLMSEAKSAYDEGTQQAQRMAAAVAVRDRAYDELVWLARWQAQRIQLSSSASEAAASLDELLRVIADTHQLSADLDAAVLAGQGPAELAVRAQEIDKRIAAIGSGFDAECTRLAQRAVGNDRLRLASLELVLSCPRLTGVQRRRLRNERDDAERKLLSGDFEVSAGTGDPPAGATDAASHTERLVSLREHPVLALLNREKLLEGQTPPAPADKPTTPEGRVTWLATKGGEVRDLLGGSRDRSAVRLADEWLKAGDRLLDERPERAAARTEASRADRLIRAASSVTAAPFRTDPAGPLRRIDVHQYLTWQAERMLDDFWGPHESEQSYFVRSTEELLAAASGVLKGHPTLQKPVRDRLASRLAALEPGLVATSGNIQPIEEESLTRHSIQVSGWNGGFPEGVAAVYVKDANSETLPFYNRVDETPVPRAGVAPQNGSDVGPGLASLVLSRQELANRGTAFEVTTLFRGHVRSSAFQAYAAEAKPHLIVEKKEYEAPSVTVYGSSREKSSLAFIFDCSGSMSKPAVAADPTSRSRLDEARATFKAILDDLAETEAYKVSLRVYGHRVRWTDSGKNKDPKDSPIHPDRDVELLLPIQVFNPKVRDQIVARLDALTPRGQTPLYYSMVEAFKSDFRESQLDTDGVNRVIVVTDGVNDEINDRTLIKAVKDAWNAQGRRRIRVDIVGFGIDEASIRAEERRRNFPGNELIQSWHDMQDFAKETGGNYYRARDPSELLAQLQATLGLRKFEIVDDTARLVEGSPKELSKTIVLDKHPQGTTREYEIRMKDSDPPVSKTVTLYGGEALVLNLKDQGGIKSLEFSLFDEASIRHTVEIEDPLQLSTRVRINSHQPFNFIRTDTNCVRFPLSIQYVDLSRFTPRPVEAWAEIQPQTADGEPVGPPYILFDVDYHAEGFSPSAPKCHFEAPAWDRERADRASITFHCKLRERSERVELQIVEARGRKDFEPCPEAPGVRFNVATRRSKLENNRVEVTATQTLAEGADDLYAVCVQMVKEPLSIERRYYGDSRTVVHVFSYDLSKEDELDGYFIRFTSRKAMLNQALSAPFTVSIPEVTDATSTR